MWRIRRLWKSGIGRWMVRKKGYDVKAGEDGNGGVEKQAMEKDCGGVGGK